MIFVVSPRNWYSSTSQAKRHHTRFFPTDQKDADAKTFNPLPGTIVDRGVTSICHFDFYLQGIAS